MGGQKCEKRLCVLFFPLSLRQSLIELTKTVLIGCTIVLAIYHTVSSLCFVFSIFFCSCIQVVGDHMCAEAVRRKSSSLMMSSQNRRILSWFYIFLPKITATLVETHLRTESKVPTWRIAILKCWERWNVSSIEMATSDWFPPVWNDCLKSLLRRTNRLCLKIFRLSLTWTFPLHSFRSLSFKNR